MKKQTNTNELQSSFIESFHRSGRIFTLIALILICLVPVVFSLSAKTTPIWSSIVAAIPFMLSYVLIGLVEVFSYAPLLGVGGQYIAFITGNISNLKLPCAINAQTITKTVRNKEEQEIITTIAIAVSSIVTTIIIALGLIPLAIFGSDIVKVLAPVSPYVIPAIFGGLGIVLISRYFKLTMVPFAIMLIVALATFLLKMDLGQSVMLTVGMAVSIISGIVIYKKGTKKEKIAKKQNDDLCDDDDEFEDE
ncbi:MAG: hypothetical protein LBE09_03165 [Christensenellaceae bacterium]|jgi:hypothetical protein|nr:hypothetical protein [Christensenellaceae bacterium]